MLKIGKEDMISKLESVYQGSFSGGTSLVKAQATTKKKIEAVDPRDKSIISWTPKDFLFYFAAVYNDTFDTQYNLSFESDMKDINIIAKYFKSLGLDFRFHTKKFVDWAFENRSEIIKKYKFITLQTIKRFLNEYVQNNILELGVAEDLSTESYDFISELNDLYDGSKMLSALKKFGIPIVATFLEHHKNHRVDKIIDNIHSISLSEEDLFRIAKASILRSPYLPDMSLLDWRKVFEKILKHCQNEAWWRSVDYNGAVNKSYRSILD